MPTMLEILQGAPDEAAGNPMLDVLRSERQPVPLLKPLVPPRDPNDRRLFTRQLESDEGRRSFVYDDATGKPPEVPGVFAGNPTIGVGFNLTRADARDILAEFGFDLDQVLRGEVELPDDVIDTIRNRHIEEAFKAARSVVPSFDSLSIEQRGALANMALNMGATGLAGFRDMLKAIDKGQFDLAAKEMLDSKYAQQVGARARRNAEDMRVLAPVKDGDLQTSLEAALGTNPDTFVEQRNANASLDLGTSNPVDSPEVRKQARIATLIALMTDSPVATRFLSNPDNAMASHDDIENMGRFERVVRAFQKGATQRDLGIAGMQLRRSRTPEAQAEVDRLDARVQELAGDRKDGFIGWMQSASTIIGQRVASMTSPEAAARTAAGGALGATLGLAGGPFAPITSTAGGAAGLFSGMAAHMISDALEVEAGQSYLDQLEMGIPHEIAQWTSLGVGIINAGLEALGATIVGKPLAAAGKAIFKKQVRQVVTRRVVQAAALKMVRAYGAAVGAEVGTEVMQELVNIAGEEIGKAFSEGDFEDLTTEQVQERLTEVFVETFKGMALLAAPGPGTTFIVNRSKAKNNKNAMTEAHRLTFESRYAARDPQKAAQLRADQLRSAGVTEVFVDAGELMRAVNEIAKSGTEVAQILADAGVASTIETAVEEGDSVVIPAEAFASVVLGKDLFDQIVDHIQIDPEVPSVAQSLEPAAQMSDQILGRVFQAELPSKLKARVQETAEKTVGKTSAEIIEIVTKAAPDVQAALDSIVADIISSQEQITDTQVQGRVAELDDRIADAERAVVDQETRISELETEDRPTSRAGARLETLLGTRDKLEQEQADLSFPKTKAGEFEDTRKAEVTKRLRKKTIKTTGKILEDLNIRTTRESIRAARRAFKTAQKSTKGNIKAAQVALNKLISQSGLKSAQKEKFRQTISSIQSVEDLAKKLPKIQARVALALEKQRKKELTAAIKKVLKQHKTKRRDGILKGKMTPEVSSMVDRLVAINKLNPEQSRAELSQRLGSLDRTPSAIEALENIVLAASGNPEQVTAGTLERILLDLSAIIIEGRAIGAASQFRRAARQNSLRAKTIEAVGVLDPGKLRGFVNRVEAIGFLGLSGAWWNKLQRAFNSSDAVLVNGVIEDLSLFEESRAYDSGKTQMVETVEALIMERAGFKSKRKLLRQLHRDSTERVELGTFTFQNGVTRKLKMTRAELRSAWMQMKNDDLKILAMDERSNGFTDEILDAINSNMSDTDIQMANAQLEFYDKYYERINIAYEKAYGVTLPKIDVYSPISRKLGEDTLDEFMQSALHLGSVVPGSVKSRTPSLKPLQFRDDFQVLSSHIMEMEYFIAYHEKVSLINSVFFGEGQAVAEQITENGGKELMQTIRNDIEFFGKKGAKSGQVAQRFFTTMMRNFGVSQLALKPQIMLKQYASFAAFAEGVKVTDFTAGLIKFASNPRAALRILNESDYFRNRGIQIDRDFQDLTSDDGSRLLNILGRNPGFTKVITTNIRWGDKTAIALGGFAHYHAQLKAGKTKAQALKSFEVLSNRTQQSRDPDQLSELQRSNGWERVLGQFMSSANALTRAEYSAIVEGAKGRITKREMAKRIVIYHLIIPNMIQFIANGFEWDKEEQLAASLLGAMNGMLIIGDVIEAAIRATVGTEDLFGLDAPHPLRFVEDVIDALRAFDKDDISFADWTEGTRAIDEAMKGIGGLTGIPLATLNNMLKGTAQVLDSQLNPSRDSDEKFERGGKMMLGFSPYTVNK